MEYRFWRTGIGFLVVLAMLTFALLQLGCTPAAEDEEPDNDPNSPVGPGQTTLNGTFWLVDTEWENDLAIVVPVERVLPGDEIYEIDQDTLKIRTRRDKKKYPIDMRDDTLMVDWGVPGSGPQPFLIDIIDDTVRFTRLDSNGDPSGETDVFVKRPSDLTLEQLDAQLEQKIQEYWQDPGYRELEYRVATDSQKSDDYGQIFSGTQAQWDALEWEDRKAYLPWTFARALPRDPQDELAMAEYCRYVAIQPEQFGYLWADWLGDRTMQQVLDEARANHYRWPGGSDAYDSVLDLYDTAWKYPEE